MGTESNWIVVLKAFYRTSDGRIAGLERDKNGFDIDENHILVEQTDMNAEELGDAVNYIKKIGMIKSVSDGTWELSKDGFDKAHDVILRERQQQTNFYIAGFTLILALTSILQFVADAFPINGGLVETLAAGLLAFSALGLWVGVFVYPEKFEEILHS